MGLSSILNYPTYPTDRGCHKMAVLFGVADRRTIVCEFSRCSEPLGKDSPKRDNQVYDTTSPQRFGGIVETTTPRKPFESN